MNNEEHHEMQFKDLRNALAQIKETLVEAKGLGSVIMLMANAVVKRSMDTSVEGGNK